MDLINTVINKASGLIEKHRWHYNNNGLGCSQHQCIGPPTGLAVSHGLSEARCRQDGCGESEEEGKSSDVREG